MVLKLLQSKWWCCLPKLSETKGVSMRLEGRGLVVVCTLLAVALFASLAVAQETTGALQGTVKDPTLAVIPGAEVALGGPALVAGRTVTSDSAGTFRFAELPPGTYSLTVTARGFRKAVQGGIVLEVGKRLSVDITLQVGDVTEVVEVTAAAPIVDTSSSKAQVNIRLDILDSLPKPRGVLALMEVAPGTRNEPASAGFQVDGASAAENTYSIEGHNTSNIRSGLPASNPPTNFFQEVVIKTSGYEAEHGGAMGGAVNAVVKPGGSDWHGAAFVYYHNDLFNAAPHYFNRRDPAFALVGRIAEPIQQYDFVEDDFKQLEPGFEIGGPVLRERLFFFGSYNPALSTTNRTVNITNVNALGPRSFTITNNTHWAVGRLDGRITDTVSAYATWVYGYQRTRGTDAPGADGKDGERNAGAAIDPRTRRPDRGSVLPNTLWKLGGDWTPTPKLVFTGSIGRWNTDSQDRGVPTGVRHLFINASAFTGLDGTPVPAGFRQIAGFSDIPDNTQTPIDDFTRTSADISGAYTFRAGGTHTVKAGLSLQRLANDVRRTTETASVRMNWNQSFTPNTSQEVALCAPVIAANLAAGFGAVCRGNYGHYVVRDFQIRGDVSSDNWGIYVQDSWNVGGGLTVNGGIRFDKEFLPSFGLGPNVIGQPIKFDFLDKVGPRIGAAWDVRRNGKIKVYGSWGWYYDIMKYELPRGSFGGDYWHDCAFTLDSFDFNTIAPVRSAAGFTCNSGTLGATPGTFLGEEDFRIPSNVIDPTCPAQTPLCNIIDPRLQPVRQTEFVLGGEWALSSSMGVEVRWASKRLRNTIEDVGILTAAGEQFLIANPGQGIAFAPLRGDCAAPGDPRCASLATLPVMPRAQRDYDGLEIRLNKRFTGNWYLLASYTWSRLSGNYSGLVSTDEDLAQTFGNAFAVGRASPNVNRYFDEQAMLFDANGNPVFGRLATDRPHTFKAFGGYRFNYWGMSTTFSGRQLWYAGTPFSSRMMALHDAPFFPWGRGTFADITRDATTGNWSLNGLRRGARNPMFTQSDLSVYHEFKPSKTNEALRIGIELNVINLLNEANTITLKDRTDRNRIFDFILFPDPTCVTTAGCATTSGIDWASFYGGFDPILEANCGTGSACDPAGLFPGVGLPLDSLYGKPLRIQASRALRFQVKVRF